MVKSELGLAALISRARTDGSALGQLLERYRPFLMAVARQRVSPKLAIRCDASDVVQQTMAEAHRAFSSFQGGSEPEFSAWIQRIHDHNLAEAVRKHVHTAKRSINRERPLNDAGDSASFCWWEPAASQGTPSQRLIKGEQALRLAALLESLPEMQREAVRLRHLEGRDLEKIAHQLNRSPAATAGLIKRGLQTLRVKMLHYNEL